MRVTITKFIELPMSRYRLQKTADVPGEILYPGLVLSGFTDKPAVDLIIVKVIYHHRRNGQSPYDPSLPDVHLVCETSNLVSGADPGMDWLVDNYGKDWDIKSLGGSKP